ncbi:hypothetical protein [Sinosporangium album]|uniref:hypothetical protein n=1 Tax=Sinosporangium album TaxID=504805 RepID=UPI0015A1B22D|nr:hypothetical protein [Sinosporangium album]
MLGLPELPGPVGWSFVASRLSGEACSVRSGCARQPEQEGDAVGGGRLIALLAELVSVIREVATVDGANSLADVWVQRISNV